MALFFWDASALIKRYLPELGSATVNVLFTRIPAGSMASTPWGYAETYSILLRRLNEGVLDQASFDTSVAALQAEVVDDPDFGLLPITDAMVFASILTIRNHNLNATDAAVLTTLLEYSHTPNAPECVLIAADHRLLRAAGAEGLKTLDPQSLSDVDVPAYLASL